MSTDNAIKVSAIEMSFGSGPGAAFRVRTEAGERLEAVLVERDDNLILGNYCDAKGKWHPIEVEHPGHPWAKLRFRDYPGEVVWNFVAGEGGSGPRAWRSGPASGKRAKVPGVDPRADDIAIGTPTSGQVWEACEPEGYTAPEAPHVIPADLAAAARLYPPEPRGASGEPLPEPMSTERLLLMAERALAQSRAVGAPGGPSFDGRLRLLAGFFKWSTDDVSRWVGALLAEKAEHVRFTGATTPADYEDRLQAIRQAAEAEARSRMRAAPPEAPEERPRDPGW